MTNEQFTTLVEILRGTNTCLAFLGVAVAIVGAGLVIMLGIRGR